MSPHATSRFVSARSSGLGVATPLGWLCATRIEAAPRSRAERKTMRASTVVLDKPPEDTILKPVMWRAPVTLAALVMLLLTLCRDGGWDQRAGDSGDRVLAPRSKRRARSERRFLGGQGRATFGLLRHPPRWQPVAVSLAGGATLAREVRVRSVLDGNWRCWSA